MVFVGTWLLWRWLLRSYLEPGYTEHNHFVVFNIFSFAQQNYTNVVVCVCVCVSVLFWFPSKSPTAADESSWAALKHSRFQNYFTLEFFSTFQKVQLQQIRAADTFRFFNFGWDDLVDGSKEGRMDGRMVPRQIMVFLFRLCLLGIILPSPWRENLTLRILFQLSRKMIKGRSPGQIFGESITNSTGVVPCSGRPSFSLKIALKFCPNWVLVIFTPLR